MTVSRYNVINLTPKTEYLQKAVELHAMGKLEVDIDSIYPFNQNDIHEAFSRLDTGRARGKILIEM